MISRWTVALLAAGGLLGGCGSGGASSLRPGPTPQEQLAMAFDPDDADNRREGVLMLSSYEWGLAEPYLKGYAMLLATDDDATVRSAALPVASEVVTDELIVRSMTAFLMKSSPGVCNCGA